MNARLTRVAFAALGRGAVEALWTCKPMNVICFLDSACVPTPVDGERFRCASQHLTAFAPRLAAATQLVDLRQLTMAV